MNSQPSGGKYCNSLVINNYKYPGYWLRCSCRYRQWYPDDFTEHGFCRTEYQVSTFTHPYTREVHRDPDVVPVEGVVWFDMSFMRLLDTNVSRSWIATCHHRTHRPGVLTEVEEVIRDNLTKEEALKMYRLVKRALR